MVATIEMKPISPPRRAAPANRVGSPEASAQHLRRRQCYINRRMLLLWRGAARGHKTASPRLTYDHPLRPRDDNRLNKRTPMAKTNASIAKKARAKAEADFATWLMMAKLGSFEDLPANAQEFLSRYRARFGEMSEAKSKTVAVSEIYLTYYKEMGGTGTAPEPEPRPLSKSPTDDNVVKFQKPRKPDKPAKPAGPAAAKRPIPALLIFAGMVALIAAYKFLAG